MLVKKKKQTNNWAGSTKH